MNNERVEVMLTEYDDYIPILEKYLSFLTSYFRDLICIKNRMFLVSVEGRVKTHDSLRGKLLLKGDKYKTLFDITDLIGIRIITIFSDEVDIIASLIERDFKIDYENSIDKRKMYEVDRFGYMSLHFICYLPDKYINDNFTKEEIEIYKKFRFEIQVRTNLQHVWATVFHDIGYKNDVEVPREYLRRLTRLAGLLEIADDEFLNIRNQIGDYRKKIKTLVSSGVFNDISFNIDSYRDYLALNPFHDLINKVAKISNAEIENVDFIRYYNVLVDLGIKNLSELESMRIKYSEAVYRLALTQFTGTDIDIIASSVVLINMVVLYVVKNGADQEKVKQVLQNMMGKNNVGESYAKKMYEVSKIIVEL